jgi:hypothetical protein
LDAEAGAMLPFRKKYTENEHATQVAAT